MKGKKIANYAMGFLLFFIFIITCSYNFADPDLWGHITFGKANYTAQSIILKDPYSYAPTKKLWVNHEWLSEILLYLLCRFSGGGGILFTRMVIAAALFIVLYKIIKIRTSSFWTLTPILFALSIVIISFGFADRPQIVTYLFFAFQLYLLYLFKYKNSRVIFLSPLLTLAWTNFHGGFLSGIGLLFIFLASESFTYLPFFQKRFENPIERKKLIQLACTFALCIVATLFNPYGIKLWRFLLKTVLTSRPYIREWYSVFSGTHQQASVTHYFIFVVLSIYFLLSSKVKRSLSDVILFAVTLIISLRHVRHIPFFALTSMAIIPVGFSEKIVAWRKKTLHLTKIISIIFLCLLSSILAKKNLPLRKGYLFRLYVDSESFPIQTVRYMKQNKIRGNVLTEFDWGQYCIWHLYPSCRIFIDGRYKTVYPVSVLNEYTRFLYDHKPDGDNFLKKYPHHWILIRETQSIISSLNQNPNWRVVLNFENENAILLAHRDSFSYQRFLLQKQKENPGYLPIASFPPFP